MAVVWLVCRLGMWYALHRILAAFYLIGSFCPCPEGLPGRSSLDNGLLAQLRTPQTHEHEARPGDALLAMASMLPLTAKCGRPLKALLICGSAQWHGPFASCVPAQSAIRQVCHLATKARHHGCCSVCSTTFPLL